MIFMTLLLYTGSHNSPKSLLTFLRRSAVPCAGNNHRNARLEAVRVVEHLEQQVEAPRGALDAHEVRLHALVHIRELSAAPLRVRAPRNVVRHLPERAAERGALEQQRWLSAAAARCDLPLELAHARPEPSVRAAERAVGLRSCDERRCRFEELSTLCDADEAPDAVEPRAQLPQLRVVRRERSAAEPARAAAQRGEQRRELRDRIIRAAVRAQTARRRRTQRVEQVRSVRGDRVVVPLELRGRKAEHRNGKLTFSSDVATSR